MEKGPVQNEGKDLVRSLVKLGYTPTRGELSTMSHSNDDYDYLYSYIKHGPSPDILLQCGICSQQTSTNSRKREITG